MAYQYHQYPTRTLTDLLLMTTWNLEATALFFLNTSFALNRHPRIMDILMAFPRRIRGASSIRIIPVAPLTERGENS